MSKNTIDFNIDDIFGGFSPSNDSPIEGGILDELNNPDIELDEDGVPVLKTPPKNEKEDDIEDKEEDLEEEEIEEDVEDNDEKEEEPENSEETVSFKELVNYLAEKGIVDNIELDELEDSPEVLEEAIFNTAKNMVQEYKESIPEEGKLFLEYLEKGGDPAKFIETSSNASLYENIDLDNEDNQKKVIRDYLSTLNMTEEEINDEIEDYEDAMLLEKKAKTAASKMKKIVEKQKQELIESQERALQKAKEDQEKYINSVKELIKDSKTLANIKVAEKDRKEFERYLFQKDADGLTPYQKDLKENPVKTQVELAYLKFKKFNFEQVKKQVKTEESQRIRSIFKKDVTPKGKSKQTNKGGDLSSFKSLF